MYLKEVDRMQVGFVGAEASGKTTLFELLSNTQGAFLSPDKANTATVDVPDDRVDKMSGLFKPKKTIYAKITFVDINRLSPGDRDNNNKSLNHLKLMDALAIVINGYTPDQDAKVMANDLDFCLSELILSDLDQVERKLNRLAKPQKAITLAGTDEKEVFTQLSATLEENAFLSTLELTPAIWKELNSYSFLTRLPMFVVVNLSEENGETLPAGMKALEEAAAQRGLPIVRMYAKLEKDLQELPDDEREIFASEYNLPLDGRNTFVQQAYATAGLVSFLTVGEDECRAWTVKGGTPAKEAAGVIHNDLTDNFVRAEVIHFDKLLECGSEQEAVKRGWMRSEKKEYPVLDGDILHILSSK
jgi:ribosome-binding ATPase